MAYNKMQADGVAPNARFFTEYIRICGRAGSMQARLHSTARMHACCLPGSSAPLPLPAASSAHHCAASPRSSCAASTMPLLHASGCAAVGFSVRVQAAGAAWRDAREAGVEPDLILYSAMIDACAKVLRGPGCCRAALGALGLCSDSWTACLPPATSLLALPHQTTDPPL